MLEITKLSSNVMEKLYSVVKQPQSNHPSQGMVQFPSNPESFNCTSLLKYFSKNFNLENTKKIYMFRDLTTGKVGLRTPRQYKQNILTFFLEARFWW